MKTDHCIDILRQVLMCASDTELIMFHWVKGWPGPTPDFHVYHECRDPEAVLQFATDISAPIKKRFSKPQGVIELPDRP